MKFRWPWNRGKKEEDIQSMEEMLESFFTPVNARPDFVEDLRQRLVGTPGPLAKAGLSTLELILLVAGGLVSVLLFVLGSIRAVIALLTGIRLIRDRSKKKKSISSEVPETNGS